LKKLGHYYCSYKNHEDLWNSFNKELDLLLQYEFKKFTTPLNQTNGFNINNRKNINTGNINTNGGIFE